MNYHNITHEDMNNGDGLRTVLWVAGCEHHCPECQNPVTWDKEGGIPFDDAAMQEIMDSLEHDYISGITFSGGDPLAPYNREKVLEIMKAVKERYPEKDIWVYTGYTFEHLMTPRQKNSFIKEIMEMTDVLVDGRYRKELRDISLMWRGSSNQHVIDVKETLKSGAKKLHCQ